MSDIYQQTQLCLQETEKGEDEKRRSKINQRQAKRDIHFHSTHPVVNCLWNSASEEQMDMASGV